jgi:hypothetical protein
VTPDDGAVISPRHHRLYEAELAEAAFEVAELLVRDPSRVGRIGMEGLERDLLNGEGSECGRVQ